ncbi:hypothetical protein VCR3J2_530085 [Vibrio coralliirubri]|uniref:hypothetical protein n=1 Tax=Vibrio coralliirubri TaxID=1516159 RepID=UPI0006327772|nr:hypothetical protein [Vibrio coralliirubri]CDU01429.1 hypothetical protein VCR3J2_530085 [Vibrio coralliirubri]
MNTNFAAIGELVTEARNLLDSIKGGAIRTMQTQFDSLLVTLNSTFSSKLASYQQQVSTVVKPAAQAIHDAFETKVVTYDPVDGDDNSLNGPFKTIGAAIASVPDGGSITIKLPYGDTSPVFSLSEGGINVGSRKITFNGGYSTMEAAGKKMAFIKPEVAHNARLNRTYYKFYLLGTTGARIDFVNCGLIAPRKFAGSNTSHSRDGSFISGPVSTSIHNYLMSGDHIVVEDNGTTEPPMMLFLSDARDNKKSMEEITLSYVRVETDQMSPLIDLRYNGTLRFSVYGATLKDKSNQPIKWGQLFKGVSYGTHGYATNLISVESITKKAV